MTRVKSGKTWPLSATRFLAMGIGALLVSSVVAGLPSGETGGPPAAPGANPSIRPVPLAATLALSFQHTRDATLVRLATERAPVARLDFNNAAPSSLGWSVSPTGTRVTVGQGRREVFVSGLTSKTVRPQAIVADAARGAVWLYGDDLYRYRAASGELVRFRPLADRFGSIREVVADASGVWLATDNGVYLFDDAKEQFSVIDHPLLAGQRIVQAVAADGAVWFAAQPSRLFKLTRSDAGRVQMQASQRLPLGVAAEMLSVHGTLWLLSSRENGEHYELAYVAPGGERLVRVAGKYYSLRALDGQLLATARRDVHVFDAAGVSVAALDFDSSRALRQTLHAGKVLFIGTSYAVKDNCEVVEHRRVDVSKGWTTPELDFFAPAAANRNSAALRGGVN